MVSETAQDEAGPSVGKVLAWASVLLGFGSIQGVIYLKAYWGNFGLDPFQFGEVSALALVGLTGIGVTVAFMGIAALVGGYLSHKLEALRTKHRAIEIAIAIGLLLVVAVLAFVLDFGLYLVAGMVLTWFLIWLAHRSPDIPDSVTRWRVLPYVALAVAYVPLASHYFGHWRADKAKNSEVRVQVDSSDMKGIEGATVTFAGRLGDEYVLFRPSDQSVLIVPVAAVRTLSLTSHGHGGTAARKQERVDSPPEGFPTTGGDEGGMASQ
jgi:hypothetical protein